MKGELGGVGYLEGTRQVESESNVGECSREDECGW